MGANISGQNTKITRLEILRKVNRRPAPQGIKRELMVRSLRCLLCLPNYNKVLNST